ncbi:hypothetical protein DFJ58DRAFT_911388 [Suillus subalutaceus]|uniref:uncharacterized protein n=1 Tax=Suillus subalutaceus TaxID=48586 RepID=UPI001B864A56|nr:uncharacterized protein DFJ58DRAFT_911388 [Suillus subalutaceus]KAG1869063.1 hypothetical protein DFJ58DRAFT_911388 [Suillus subalutaceus]
MMTFGIGTVETSRYLSKLARDRRKPAHTNHVAPALVGPGGIQFLQGMADVSKSRNQSRNPTSPSTNRSRELCESISPDRTSSPDSMNVSRCIMYLAVCVARSDSSLVLQVESSGDDALGEIWAINDQYCPDHVLAEKKYIVTGDVFCVVAYTVSVLRRRKLAVTLRSKARVQIDLDELILKVVAMHQSVTTVQTDRLLLDCR